MFGSRNFLFAKGGSGAAQFKLFMWGDNPSGVLGLGNITGYSSPKQVGALTDWATLSSNYHTLCTKVNGQLWAWGNNGTGRLGLGNTTNYSSPKQVGALTSWGKPTTGNNFSLCIKTDGTLWSWGNNALGQLGLGNTTAYSSPKQIGSLTTWSKAVSTFRSVLATDTAGKLFAWGKNSEGQLGLGDLTNRSSPVQVGALTNWSKPTVAYKHSLCLKTDGTLWAWGANASGQLGLGNTTAYSSPKQVGALTDWALPSVGYQSSFSVCTKTDGSLWSWGSNSNGALGLNNATSYSSPKQIGSLTTWLTPSVAGDSASCVKTDGTLWTWGRGSYGSLGDGTTANRSSPVQIGTLTNWVQPSRGVSFTAGCIQGVVTAAPISLTVPVISGTAVDGYTLTSSYGTWSSFPASFAFQWQRGTSNISGATSSSYLVNSADIGSTLRCVVTATNSFGAVSANSVNTATVTAFTGGQLWTWGRNNVGQLGLGNTTNYSSPKQVGSSVTWTKIQGGYQQMFAINSAGQLWSWGLGGLSNNAYFGSGLGVGDATYRSSPTQVGALTNWAMVAGGGYGGQQPTASVKTDGTLWTWGSNSSGGLATTGGATVSPNQVGSNTDIRDTINLEFA